MKEYDWEERDMMGRGGEIVELLLGIVGRWLVVCLRLVSCVFDAECICLYE